MRTSKALSVLSLALVLLFVASGCGGPVTAPTDAGQNDGATSDVGPRDAASTDGGDAARVDAAMGDGGGDDAAIENDAAIEDDAAIDDDAAMSCSSPSECPGTDTECSFRTCMAGVCGIENPSGTATAAQTAGDCLVHQCDGAGSEEDVPDDADLPSDSDECTSDVCTAGVPSNPPAVAGTACTAAGVLCDGAGACVECLAPTDCPGTDGLCAMRTCSPAGVCGMSFVATGMAVGTQAPGDCHEVQCNGTGATVDAIQDADVRVDGNACTSDVCTLGVPSNPPLVAGASCPGGLCNAAGMCSAAPVITSVDYLVAARGARLVLTGTGFTGTTTVTIGGISQTFSVGSDTQITIASVADATPVGARGVIVTAPGGASAPFGITVIALVINELDADTAGTDVLEFVEIATGVPGVSLAGYTLVLWNGAGDISYSAIQLNATTDANGLLLLGNAGVVPAPAITFGNGLLQNGVDAAGIYQALPAAFPVMTPLTATSVIDAVVYDTADADSATLLDTLLGVGPERVQLDEGANPASETQSIQRCRAGRRDGRTFLTGTPPTPGLPNPTTC